MNGPGARTLERIALAPCASAYFASANGDGRVVLVAALVVVDVANRSCLEVGMHNHTCLRRQRTRCPTGCSLSEQER